MHARTPFLFIIHLIHILQCRSIQKVSISITESPIILGQTAKLSCVASNETVYKLNSRTWIRHDNGIPTTLFHHKQTNYARIQEVHGEGEYEYILKINNFGEKDIKLNYSCSYGQYDDKLYLDLNERDFKYIPLKNETLVETTLEDRNIKVFVQLSKVYPIPNCSISHSGNNNIKITKYVQLEKQKNGIFFNVAFNEEFSIVNLPVVLLSVTCDIGQSNVELYMEQFQISSCTTDSCSTPTTIAGVIAGVLCIVIIGIVYHAYEQKRKGNVQITENRYQLSQSTNF